MTSIYARAVCRRGHYFTHKLYRDLPGQFVPFQLAMWCANILEENGMPASRTPAAAGHNGHTRCPCGRMGEWKDTDRPVLANVRATLAMQEYFKVVPRTTGANPHSDLTFTAVP